VTHSLCTLEFEDHRPLYDWVLENVTPPCRPRQIEFARLNVNYTITSKRKLMRLVNEGYVDAWNDPRMPTLSGMRRRGFTRRQSASSATWWASTRPAAPWTWACSSTPSATT